MDSKAVAVPVPVAVADTEAVKSIEFDMEMEIVGRTVGRASWTAFGRESAELDRLKLRFEGEKKLE